MAKTSKINRQLQRERMVAKYAERRAEYKRDSVNPHLTAEERAEAMRKLQALPRDASPTRLRNRDSIDGRPRAYNRKFGLSRINLREKAHKGKLPGVVKIQLVIGPAQPAVRPSQAISIHRIPPARPTPFSSISPHNTTQPKVHNHARGHPPRIRPRGLL